MNNLTFDAVIQRIKTRHQLESDYQVCKRFGLSVQNMSGWRKGRSHPDEKMCLILADAAGLDPLVLIASMQSMRSKTDEVRTLWEQVAARLSVASGSLAAVILSVVFSAFFIAPDAIAASAEADKSTTIQRLKSLYIVEQAKTVLFWALSCVFLVPNRSIFSAWENQQ